LLLSARAAAGLCPRSGRPRVVAAVGTCRRGRARTGGGRALHTVQAHGQAWAHARAGARAFCKGSGRGIASAIGLAGMDKRREGLCAGYARLACVGEREREKTRECQASVRAELACVFAGLPRISRIGLSFEEVPSTGAQLDIGPAVDCRLAGFPSRVHKSVIHLKK
jgi:hypothetical protein